MPLLVDIESFFKQFCQKSKPLDFQKKWNLFKFLKENDVVSNGFKIQDSIEDYLNRIATFIEQTITSRSSEELKRFENIEIPINQLIYSRQRKGISIDSSLYPSLIKTIEEELYEIKNKLQLTFRIYTPDSVLTQIEVLKAEGVEIKGATILSLFKSSKDSSEICNLFYEMLKAKNDLSALIYLTATKGGDSRTFPNFNGFGSISSRITLREPALQNIRKSIRRVIKPEDGYEFIYVDYSQFEAGILASLSQDEKLQSLYGEDIYDDINKKVWGGLKTREEAKILFYKYMYGVDFKSSKESLYFKSFVNLAKFKREVEKDILKSGKVGTSNGNYRILENECISIALSHRIQAEASLIFKEALLKVQKEIPEVDFVLPMHDAALYEINILKYNKKDIESKIKKAFKSVYARKCPGIVHAVNMKDFYND